ncbi:hypothetical protein ANO11243_093870 [Dothideomycetidae sp. 11243]|nr:hypothetical protein ANO11243_093870 [fungal sp. No.11243]
MQMWTLTLVALSVAATPNIPLGRAAYNPCPTAGFTFPECCSSIVAGIGENCVTTKKAPKNADDFTKICDNQNGRVPACCATQVSRMALTLSLGADL